MLNRTFQPDIATIQMRYGSLQMRTARTCDRALRFGICTRPRPTSPHFALLARVARNV